MKTQVKLPDILFWMQESPVRAARPTKTSRLPESRCRDMPRTQQALPGPRQVPPGACPMWPPETLMIL